MDPLTDDDRSERERAGPPRPGKGYRLEALIGGGIEWLRRHRGDWKIVRSYASHTGAHMALPSARKAFPDCEFESHVTRDDEGRRGSELWARCPKEIPNP